MIAFNNSSKVEGCGSQVPAKHPIGMFILPKSRVGILSRGVGIDATVVFSVQSSAVSLFKT
jgi:hypothetical protein